MTFLSRLNLKKVYTPCAYIAITAVLIGVIVFQSRWHYAESGHGLLLTTYILLCSALLIMLRRGKTYLAALCILSMGLVIGYATLKFDWRESYFTNAYQKSAPAIDRYITNYPTFEKNYLSWLSGQPRWFAFSEDCFEPALKGRAMGKNCHSVRLIQDHYNMDVKNIIDTQYNLMRETANRIAQGEMTDIDSYRTCLNNRSCAYLPLLPPRSVADEHNLPNEAHQKIRRQFWSIRNNEMIQPEICDLMTLCQVMRNADVIIIRAKD